MGVCVCILVFLGLLLDFFLCRHILILLAWVSHSVVIGEMIVTGTSVIQVERLVQCVCVLVCPENNST